MPTSEEDKQRLKDKAVSYQTMMDMWAWKDFYAMLEQKEKYAIADLINGIDMEVNRGIAICVQEIRDEIQRILAV